MFLRRYCYPNRLSDCTQFFGRPQARSSLVMHHLYDNFHHILATFDHRRLTPEFLERCAQAVSPSCLMCGFLDGTVCPIATSAPSISVSKRSHVTIKDSRKNIEYVV